jgi:hypothetical protein
MPANPFTIVQDIFRDDNSPVEIEQVHINDLTPSIVEKLNVAHAGFIGLAPAYDSRCSLVSIALGSKSYSLTIRLGSRKPMKKSSREILNALLCDNARRKVAFKMDGIAIGLYLDYGLYVTRGIDLFSLSNGTRGSIECIMNAVGGELNVHRVAVIKLFEGEQSETNPRKLAMQAWVACRAGSLPSLASEISVVQEIDTTKINTDVCIRTFPQ